MRALRTFGLITALSLLCSACASLNSVSLTPVPANRTNEVRAESNRWVILGLNFDNDYADRVSQDLARRCPNGKVSGILTKDEVYYYFLFLVVKRNVQATGYCDRAGVAMNTESAR